MIAVDEGEAKTVSIKDCQKKTDPLKEIGTIEIKLNEKLEIVGLDLNGDVVVRK
jgi:hypothetical protein